MKGDKSDKKMKDKSSAMTYREYVDGEDETVDVWDMNIEGDEDGDYEENMDLPSSYGESVDGKRSKKRGFLRRLFPGKKTAISIVMILALLALVLIPYFMRRKQKVEAAAELSRIMPRFLDADMVQFMEEVGKVEPDAEMTDEYKDLIADVATLKGMLNKLGDSMGSNNTVTSGAVFDGGMDVVSYSQAMKEIMKKFNDEYKLTFFGNQNLRANSFNIDATKYKKGDEIANVVEADDSPVPAMDGAKFRSF